MAIVYRHRRLDNLEVFYIGIGKRKERAYNERYRNILWQRIVKKSGYKVEIIKEGISYDEAKELEIFLINEYGRLDKKTGCLSNLTDGGDGCHNRIVTLETRKKISNFNKGRKHSEETKKKMSVSGKGIGIGIKLTEEHKEKLRNLKIGVKLSKEHVLSLSVPKSELGRLNIANGNKGKNLGLKRTLDTKELLGIKKRKKVINTETGYIYNSLSEASISINTTKSTLSKKLKGQMKNNTNFKYLNI